MPIKDKDQPGRTKPNESENQPQFASRDEVPPGAPQRPSSGGQPDHDRETDERRAGGEGQPSRGRS
jgi:hypothetical protein